MKKLLTTILALFVAISAWAAPSITTQPTNKTNLIGTTNVFNVVASGGSLRYQWYFGAYTNMRVGSGLNQQIVLTNKPFAPINRATNNSLSVVAALQNYGLYYVRITNSTGLTNSRTVSLTITNVPPPTNTIITLWWTNKPNAVSYEVWSTTNLTKPMTLYTNVGLATNLVLTFRKGDPTFQNRFYSVRANQGNPFKSVNLAWDASPDAAVTGYKLYVGPSAGSYTNTISLGRTTLATVNNLRVDSTYFFTVTATDGTSESVPSNEISYRIPAPATVTNKVSAYVNIAVKQ